MKLGSYFLLQTAAACVASSLIGCSGSTQSSNLPQLPLSGAVDSVPAVGSTATLASRVSGASLSNVDRSAMVPDASYSSRPAATYKGCNVFAAGGYYNSDVTNATVDSHSSNYLSSLMATDNTGFYASTGLEPVNVASSSTSKYSVRPKVSWHSFPVPYPWSSSFSIEPAGDAHLIVLQATPPTCHLYEAYSTSFTSNVLSAYSGANWDLSQPYIVPKSSAMASGLSLFAGSVRHEEIATGIKHALNFSVFSQAPCNCYVVPASGTDGRSYSGPSTAYQMPYGAHLRLRSTFNDASFGPQSKAIAEAMKHYGIYLADTGGHFTNNNAIYTANPTDGGSWDQSDLRALGALRFSDFEVLSVGAVTQR